MEMAIMSREIAGGQPVRNKPAIGEIINLIRRLQMAQKSYHIFINGKGYPAVGYQIAPVFFNYEKPNGELVYIPWTVIESVRLDKHWLALLKKRQAEEERQRNPKVQIPGHPVIPFDPNGPKS